MPETTLDDTDDVSSSEYWGVVGDVKLEETAGVFFIFILALILLFALLRAQKRNRKLLEGKIRTLEAELEA